MMKDLAPGENQETIDKITNTVVVVENLEEAIISAHKKYFQPNSATHGSEESLLYKTIVKYFTATP
jgi:hypothetical protein